MSSAQQGSSLSELIKKHAAGTTTNAAAPATPAPAAPEAPAASATPAASAAPAVQQATTAVLAPVNPNPTPGQFELALPENVEQAGMVLASLFGEGRSMDMSADAAAVDQGGNAFSMPYARLAKGKWEPQKDLEKGVYAAMPLNDRPYYAIFIGYRVGGTAWKGAMTGSPPTFKCVGPNTIVGGPKAKELFDKIMSIGSRVKFTKREEKVKFDTVGRLVPEIHILVWTPETGMITLVIPGHKPVLNTIDALQDACKRPLMPYKFTTVRDSITNKNAAESADNKHWDEWSLAAAPLIDQVGAELLKAFAKATAENKLALSRQCVAFMMAQDYDGLRGAPLESKLKEYDAIA